MIRPVTLNVSFPLKQLASFQRVDSFTVVEACKHMSLCFGGGNLIVCAQLRGVRFLCLFNTGGVGRKCGTGHC